ncbi:endonuclease/exonuclease/phosphatase family protein [Lignipirellula cremea]|uniref:endonuclease/exonuclease/phosphatase family protein n=1 Tax=Lignipirellula cremea TaxID=2528010 RepID=UPI001E2C7B2D|nr:endonuclease/exonuclease/phosphatase family protein [Lignipirellula cremea]
MLLALGFMGGGWLFIQQYDIEGLDRVRVVAKNDPVGRLPDVTESGAVAAPGETIKVASFNLCVYGVTKASKPEVMEMLARIIRQYDVTAIQEIRSQDQTVLPKLVQLVNSTGRQFDYVIGPALGRTNSKEQYAYIFDRATLEIDLRECYTVKDPNDVLHREPFVAWFRARGPAPEEAFTFSLANFHIDPDEVPQEVKILPIVLNAIRNDGRNEDDVILLGDFNADELQLAQYASLPNVTMAITGEPTNTKHTKGYDNIIFQQYATTEYVGRSGVFDFLRQFNMTVDNAMEVSDHMPVWAEFSVYEGGANGRFAVRNATTNASLR